MHLLGRISEDDKAALLGAADVFAMACRTRWGGLEQEGFGIVFVEAAACGTPTVANTALIQVFGQGGNDTISLNEAGGALPRANLFPSEPPTPRSTPTGPEKPTWFSTALRSIASPTRRPWR